MDILTNILNQIGIQLDLVIALSGAVLLIVNLIKDKSEKAGYIISGGYTMILSLLVSAGLCFGVYYYSLNADGFNWLGAIISTVICWLGPDSLNGYVNRKVGKISG